MLFLHQIEIMRLKCWSFFILEGNEYINEREDLNYGTVSIKNLKMHLRDLSVLFILVKSFAHDLTQLF